MFRRKDDPLWWARGRLVAIRPDGARRSFDPEATMLLRTDEERRMSAVVLDELYDEVKARGFRLPWADTERVGEGD